MPLWLWFADSLLVIVVLAILGLVAVVVRRRALQRATGSFEMSVTTHVGPTARGWSVGTAVYRSSRVEWFRTFSLSWRPKLVLPRGDVVIEGRRAPQAAEVHVLPRGQLVVDCDAPAGTYQLAMTPQSLTGLLAWLESSPPGRGVNRVL